MRTLDANSLSFFKKLVDTQRMLDDDDADDDDVEDHHDVLILRNFADTHACKELHKRSHKFALQNFQEVRS